MASTNHLGHQLLVTALQDATIRCLLLDTSTSYTYAPEDEFVSDLPTGAEPGDASYARQDVDDASGAFSQDDTDDEGVYDPADVTFSSLSTTNDIQTVAFYAQDGFGSAGTDDTTPTDDPLVAVYDDDSGDGSGIADLPIATNGSDLTITIDAEGLLNISTAT